MIGTGEVTVLKRAHLARDILEVIALALILFLATRLAIQNYHVENVSMQPTLVDGENVIVNKLAYLFHPPERGDVIVFHWPLDTRQDFIKRIIGIPGDVIRTDSTHVWVNGVLLNEPYIKAPYNAIANVWKLGKDQYFVMGDNRPDSDDSRNWGVVPRNYIVGKAIAVYWPIDKWQVINTYPAVFARIPTNNPQTTSK
uniref:Signal peptidase I n=1 Tax=Thermogemmatispora argillosa TaxID=2045280 RepID=A0A455T3G5_9CHLR|nr:signal peptidase I [Thermogemmatispora argillosa]